MQSNRISVAEHRERISTLLNGAFQQSSGCSKIARTERVQGLLFIIRRVFQIGHEETALSLCVRLQSASDAFQGVFIRDLGFYCGNIFLLDSFVNLVPVNGDMGGSLNSKPHIIPADAQDLNLNLVTDN